MIRIVGIDPGYAIVGYGAVDYAAGKFTSAGYGAVTTEAGAPFYGRLLDIDREITAMLQAAAPDAVAIEKLFFNSNQKTAIDVAQARGVIVAAAGRLGLPIYEYTPLQVKQAIVGYGRAEKHQVMEMTRILLNLGEAPKPDDAADALAIAICHAHSAKLVISG